MITDEQVRHLIDLCKKNASHHHVVWKRTGSDYRRGQWKVYTRIAKCLALLERAERLEHD